MKNYKIYVVFAYVILLAITFVGCKKQEIPTYTEQNALYFQKNERDADNRSIRVDTAVVSSAFFPGQAEFTHHFKINLIGPLLIQDCEYRIICVDSLTQADALQYVTTSTKPIFKAGVTSDSLSIVVQVGKIPEGYKGYITYRLLSNDWFMDGYSDSNSVKIWVNNIPTKPAWWTKTIDQSYLGAYSSKKFSEFVKFTGLITLDDKTTLQKRRICLDFKEYIRVNNITEDEDGLIPMVIPIY